MKGNINPKILGSTVIGFALVAGAYTISHFGEPHRTYQPADIHSAVSTERVAIAVADSNNDGIEDWQDEFITSKAVVLNQASSTYTTPDTLTGQMSVGFMENIIRARGYGPFGSSDDEIIKNTIDVLSSETSNSLYDIPDIIIMDEWDDQDIVNYANTAAATLYRNSVPDLEGELEILHDIVTNNNVSRMAELQTLAEVYRGYKDDTLKIPVPKFLVKEHLDLINTYNAILFDIEGMTLAFDDPAVTLLRLKRYEDDATGLVYALQNMYRALEPYSNHFSVDDPAILFTAFSPDYQI